MTTPNPRLAAVELAYPLERDGVVHEPDATVELPYDDARQLVQDGRARWPQQTESAQPTNPQSAQSIGTGVPATGNPEGAVTGG